HGKAHHVRLPLAEEALHGLRHVLLDQHQVGHRHPVVGVQVAGEGGQGPVRHADGDRGHVLERVRHGEKEDVHGGSPSLQADPRPASMCGSKHGTPRPTDPVNHPEEESCMSSDRADLGIIGGSGLYEMEGFAEVREVAVDTPFGPPSDHFMIGALEGRRVAFLPRHARGHRLLPGELDYRATVFHRGGTYVCIDGPHFSTRAESELYRSWGMDVIGMTNLQEAKLAREAEICYSTLAMVTDYDCWHPEHDSVTAESVIANLGKNAATAKAVLKSAVRRIVPGSPRECECAHALRHAL